jgi:hypothetical protein
MSVEEAAGAEAGDKRAVPRTRLAERPVAWVRGMRDVHLLDLSRTGARIEHLDLLRLRTPCHLELPPLFGALILPAQVVWCAVIGRKRKLGGESHLVAWSGLQFTALTVAQRAALADLLRAQQSPVA